jgi:hypothetical protein
MRRTEDNANPINMKMTASRAILRNVVFPLVVFSAFS